MAAVRIFLCVFCLAFAGRGWCADCGVVSYAGRAFNGSGRALNSSGRALYGSGREFYAVAGGAVKVLDVARSQLGVRELSGKNDGVEVEGYLKYVGFGKGYAWCAAFVSWCFWKSGYPQPRTAWSPALFPASRLVTSPSAGAVYGIYFPELKRIAHCGIMERMQGDFCGGIEGNTNLEGSREGQGVYRRLRHLRTIKAFAKWD